MKKAAYYLIKAIRCVIVLIRMIVQPFVSCYLGWYYERSTVPPISDPLLQMSATEIADKIKSKKLTAVQLMTSFIERAKLVNPIVNAAVAERYSAAMEEAKILDQKIKDGNKEILDLPFLGVPISVKEAFQLEGMPNTSGLQSRVGKPAQSSAPVVRYLIEAGGIPFLMTNISELCMWLESANNVYGRTKSAYDTRRIVGGSSGGEGCILTSAASVIGIGSDIGGSIRMPAFFNGVFGHKPSRGVVDNTGQYPIASGDQLDLLTTGPLCRYVVDLMPMFRVMSRDPPELKLKDQVELHKLRFFSMENDGGSLLQSPVSKELVEAQRKVVSYLEESLGVVVTKVNIRRMKYSLEMWSARMSTPGNTTFSELMAGEVGSVNGIAELGRWLIGQSKHTLPAIMLAAVECLSPLMEKSNAKFLKMLSDLDEELKTLLGNGGILLYPSHPNTAQFHNQPLTTPTNFAYTGIFNALGLPVTQCPLGLDKNGLPLGIQVVGAMKEDRNTLAVAKHLAEGPAGWVPPGYAAGSRP